MSNPGNGVGLGHTGEDAVRLRVGMAPRNASAHGNVVPEPMAEFLWRQSLVVIGSHDDQGLVWASPVSGPPGTVQRVNDRMLALDAPVPPGDPLAHAFDGDARDIGMVTLEPQTARRLRINGAARRVDGQLLVRSDQVLGNCPKYIQCREVATVRESARQSSATAGTGITPSQAEWITGADTFFIASHAPGYGADASHRGGEPGFVTVAGPRRITWPDYKGNNMYMTLGNMQLSPGCGLLFLDWEHGHALHLSGRARVEWEPERAAEVPGALRVVEFDVERVVEVRDAARVLWSFVAPSRFNPPVAAAG